MYSVSQLWKIIVSEQEHWFDVKVSINGVEYPQTQIFEITTDLRMFTENQPKVGGCLASELKLRILTPSATIPRMAQIVPYVRATDGVNTAEWIPQGVYYIDTREQTQNDDGLDILTLHAYDAMLKTETDYPDTTHAWPYPDTSVVQEIASALGVGVDERTFDLMTQNYQISLPAGYSMREVLSNIAAMYAGNWIMNYDGDLLLVAVNGIPPETNVLVDNVGDAITFGGDRILV